MRKTWLFVGCNTWDGRGGDGICSYSFDLASGKFGENAFTYTDIPEPTFIKSSKDGRLLYATIETANFNSHGGGVAAFTVNSQTGALTLLNHQPTSGSHPCHIALDPTEHCLIVTNYSGGSAAIFPLSGKGEIGAHNQLLSYQGSSQHPERQTQSHAHSAVISPDNQYVFIQDLGTDRIYQYYLDVTQAKLTPNRPATIDIHAGAGPRHMVFHPQLSIAYLINELDSTVIVFDYHPSQGHLIAKQTIASLPENFTDKNTAADIHITSDGRFLYVSNRGYDNLAIFLVNEKTGELTLIDQQPTLGQHPRNFMITPDDNFLLCANRNTDNIVSFRINLKHGRLTPVANLNVKKPTCVALLSGKLL